jgi:hypothetical protein
MHYKPPLLRDEYNMLAPAVKYRQLAMAPPFYGREIIGARQHAGRGRRQNNEKPAASITGKISPHPGCAVCGLIKAQV